ncbi:putative phosphodiesterase [Priestia taiwanensis]|uniref:Calcineurin-like phosphoesterase domain-containing protein n=2 Tax=Priestia taiwanensis TaxID=1347902 RepID=A0A917EM14_9BACI|nr:putative phosphodiesterase [Priestia taiwanensis]GGE60099.1 hypothetical protein GCM10007140_08120 [Priestia taiwanensis]
MIGIGPNTNAVLEILFSRHDISMITGNHDEAILAILKGDEHPLSHSHAKEHHQWIAHHMNKNFIPKLERLPRAIKKTMNGHAVLFTHYHMEKNKLNKPISQDPFSKIVKPSLENVTKLFKGYEESLICFGHHHPIHLFKSEKTIYLNPGSLGCNTRAVAPYSIVNIEQDKIEVRLEEVAYDNVNFLASYERLQVPDRDFILKVFHGNQSYL